VTNYKLPSGEQRCIDNKYEIGQTLILNRKEGKTKVVVKSIYVKYCGVNYLVSIGGSRLFEAQESDLELEAL
jgi:hypothetical protein